MDPQRVRRNVDGFEGPHQNGLRAAAAGHLPLELAGREGQLEDRGQRAALALDRSGWSKTNPASNKIRSTSAARSWWTASSTAAPGSSAAKAYVIVSRSRPIVQRRGGAARHGEGREGPVPEVKFPVACGEGVEMVQVQRQPGVEPIQDGRDVGIRGPLGALLRRH